MIEDSDLPDIISSLTNFTTDPERPFNGQRHTSQGERGKTEVRGIRYRDLSDAVCKAWIDAAGHTILDEGLQDELRQRADDGTLNYNDLYELECGDVDPVALIQNVCVRVEKLMGIYPNVPRLRRSDG